MTPQQLLALRLALSAAVHPGAGRVHHVAPAQVLPSCGAAAALVLPQGLFNTWV